MKPGGMAGMTVLTPELNREPEKKKMRINGLKSSNN